MSYHSIGGAKIVHSLPEMGRCRTIGEGVNRRSACVSITARHTLRDGWCWQGELVHDRFIAPAVTELTAKRAFTVTRCRTRCDRAKKPVLPKPGKKVSQSTPGNAYVLGKHIPGGSPFG